MLSNIQEAERTLQMQGLPAIHRASRHHAEWLMLRAGGAFAMNDMAAAADVMPCSQPQLSLLDDFHTRCFTFFRCISIDRPSRTEMVAAAEAGSSGGVRARRFGGRRSGRCAVSAR